MPGVPKELIEPALKVDSKAIPKKQRLWRFSPDKREAIKKELAKLLAAGFIKEVYHPPNGWRTLYSSRRRTIMSGGCASTTLI
jgi:hypothetical protein